MIQVIVADDEFFARKALIKMLKESSEEVEICGEAEDGTEVLAILEKQKADIVVTDIRMPEMDGLRLAKEISEKYPDTCVVIESGYADFDYAKTAIRYGVKEYLTKPIKPEELEKAVLRIEEEKRKIQQNIEKQLSAQRGQFMDFSHVLENESLSSEILGDMFQEMEKGPWYLAAAQSIQKEITEEQIHKVLEIFENTEGERTVRISYFYPKNEFILLVTKSSEDEKTLKPFLKRKLAECIRTAGTDLSLGLSHLHKQPKSCEKEAGTAYREAVYAVNQRLLHPGQKLYTYEAEVNVLQLFSAAEERELERCLTENKTEEAVSIVNRLFIQCENNPEVSIYSLFTSLIQIMNVINRVYSRKKDQDGTAEADKNSYLLFHFKTDLYAFRSIEELKKYIFQLLQDVSGEESQKSSIIEDLLKYLEWNYQYDITVNELAAHKYFVNPSYLSRLFKAETGKTFSRYLMGLRMEKAAEMLKESRLKISDVALCVGYNDVSYFIQTFKKYYAVTPEQYKNS